MRSETISSLLRFGRLTTRKFEVQANVWHQATSVAHQREGVHLGR